MQSKKTEKLLQGLDPILIKEVKAVTDLEIVAIIDHLEPVGQPADEKRLGELLPVEKALLVVAQKKKQAADKLAEEHNAFVDTEEFEKLRKRAQNQRTNKAQGEHEDLIKVYNILVGLVWNNAKKRLGYDYEIVELRKGGVIVAPTVQFPVCHRCKRRHPTSSLVEMLFDGISIVVIRP